MKKSCLLSVLLLGMFVCTAPALYAQKGLKFRRTPVRRTATFRLQRQPALPSVIRYYAPIQTNRYTPVTLIPQISAEALQKRIALAQQGHLRAKQRAQLIPQTLGAPVTLPTAQLALNGVVLDVLSRGERAIMGSAYNAEGGLIGHLQSSDSDVPLNQLEKAFAGAHVDTLILMVRSAPTDKTTPAKSRIITYTVSTQEIKVVHP